MSLANIEAPFDIHPLPAGRYLIRIEVGCANEFKSSAGITYCYTVH
jgi:hypothetical protein